MKKRETVLLAVCAALLAACEKTPQPGPSEEAWAVRVVTEKGEETDDTPTFGWRASYESLTVRLEGRTEETGTVLVASSEDWLRLAEETLPADGIVSFAVKGNSADTRRRATLTFSDAANPALNASLEVIQLGAADNDENGDAACDVLYIGYGYDVYKALDSPMAVRTTTAILDYARLQALNSGSIYNVVTDCHLSRLEMKYVTTNSIYAYGEDLTRQQTADTENNIQGCRQDCIDAVENIEDAAGNLQQQNFGHGSLEKAVAARVADKGALLDLKQRGILPFTEDYNDRLREIRRNTGSKRARLVTAALVEFGTHVIVQTDLGGRIDYSFTMSKEVGFNSYEEMQKEIEYTLGRISDDERSGNKRTSSSKQAEGAIAVKGGSPATRGVLEGDIRGLSPSGQIPPNHLTDWLASITYSDAPERDPSLDVIHFELMPVWDLVPQDMRQDFLDATLQMVQRSDCQLPDSFLGTDIYEMDAGQKDLFDFSGAGNDGSLCRILYYGGEPVLEVCSEYVPKIRTDERVTVAYPIYRQHIRMNQGLFIGDGVHQPAIVGFSGADSFVQPIEDMAPGSRISKFYYVNGSILFQSPSGATLNGQNRTVQDDAFYFDYSGFHRHPIVKIGSQFWTRRDIDHKMGFSPKPNSGKPTSDEYLRDGVLYGRFDLEIHHTIMETNDWSWGRVPNEFFDDRPNKRWYLPRAQDVEDLYEFLGFNPKALFPGQVSGFDARFNGYMGLNDVLNGNEAFPDLDIAVRYPGEINVIATRNEDAMDDALFLVMDGNYHIAMYQAIGEWHENYYPIRPVRGYQFEYPTLQTINQYAY